MTSQIQDGESLESAVAKLKGSIKTMAMGGTVASVGSLVSMVGLGALTFPYQALIAGAALAILATFMLKAKIDKERELALILERLERTFRGQAARKQDA